MNPDSTLAEFIPQITWTFRSPRHLGPLLALFDGRLDGESVRACLSVPPRHSKTETVLHGIARYLLRHPEWTVGYVSYAADIARSKSRQARDYAQRAGVRLRDDSAALHEWRTPEGGGLLATGIGGPLTGHGVRLLVIDDPFKNREEADSALVREKVHQWFTSTAMTRVEPGGSVLVVHTRWHRDDLIGRLAKDPEVNWEVTNLPAIDAEGRALWPERWPLDALKSRRAEVGEYDWESLYQGAPTARKGRVYPAFSRSTHVEPHAEIERQFKRSGRWRFRRIVVGVDWGHTNPGCMLVLGQTGTGTIYVLHEEYHRQLLVAEDGWLGIAARLVLEFRPELFACDPSEPGYMAALSLHSCDPIVWGADNDVHEGIRRVAVKLATPTRLLVSDACPNLIDELETYSYRTTSGALSEQPNKGHDHACDALRYAVRALTQDE